MRVPVKSQLKKVLTSSVVGVMALSAVALVGCGPEPTPVGGATGDVVAQPTKTVTKLNGQVFGTFYYITVPGGYPGGEETLRSDAEFVFAKVGKAISTFDDSAEIARFNAQQNTNDFPISSYLATVLEEVQRQSRRIGQAMDPTVGPLVNLWGFGPKGQIEHSPTDEQVAETRSYVGLDKFSLRRAGGTAFLVKSDPRVELDLSTVGEGLAADELAALMDQKGVANYMIAIAGAIRSKGANPEGKLWRVGIEDPLSQGQKVFTAVCPQGMAISTAGSYRNFFIDDKTNNFYSHVIDPETGRPIAHRTVSVSVVDRSALVTDALDTGLLVWGAKKAVEWGNKNDVAVYAIEIDDKGQPHESHSRAFDVYLKCKVNQSLTQVAPLE